MLKSYTLDFLLFIPLENVQSVFIFRRYLKSDSKTDYNQSFLYYPDNSKFKFIESDNNILGVCGDPIGFYSEYWKKQSSDKFDVKDFLFKHPGHYYLFYFNKKSKKIIISSALFGMLPLFYYHSKDYILISSRIRLILDFFPQIIKINKRFLVEQLLFNYSLFDNTIIENIRLCSSNKHIEIENNKVNFIKHFDITSFYSDKPNKIADSADKLATLFIERFNDYTTKEKSIISFTGGFDGRTLVACAKHFNMDFSTYSLGTKLNSDIFVPLENSKQLGLHFIPFFLEDVNYFENNFYESGKELIEITSLMTNFVYTHFLYSAKLLSRDYNYLYTGYFGSELFRALHLTGAFNSKELVTFFKESDEDTWINYIKNSPKLRYINIEIFKNEIEEIIEELINYKRENKDKFDNLNKFFYKYVLEEIFRKVFGPQIFAQSNYIPVRTPLLDIDFIKELFKTKLAGVNNDFFTHNPLKRIKGQILYAKIISKTWSELANVQTQKGYTPNDLLSFYGNLKIALPYFYKKTKRKISKPNLDNLSIVSGLKYNWMNFRELVIGNEIYNIKELDTLVSNINNIPEYQRDILSFAASSSMFINAFIKK